MYVVFGQQDETVMTMHVFDGRIVHLRDELIRYNELDLWLEATMCRLCYVRKDHRLEQRAPPEVQRCNVTVEPIDCMACLVKAEAE